MMGYTAILHFCLNGGGETTAAVVIPLSRSLNFKEVTVAFLTLETAMNTIFS
jgi:hypothetical protein